jgi:hypothetical protein
MAERPTNPQAPGAPRDRVYLTPRELVDRWRGRITVKTLANWRSTGRGPAFVKLGSDAGPKGRRIGGVVYELRSVRAFEDANAMTSTQTKAPAVPPTGPVTRGS